MRKHIVVLSLLVAAALLAAGCMESGRNIEDEAKERERFAQKTNDFDVVAVLSGPQSIAPGALVWYSAYGSHDPDFLGATKADLRDDEPETDGYVRYQDDVNDIHFSWYVPLFERTNNGLGTGIRTYEWQVDDGPVLHSFDLTHRYSSEDGPVRFPLGFTEPGEHTLTLTVIGWDGSRDTATMEIRVEEGGTGSTVSDWTVTEDGWVYNRSVDLEPMDYSECPLGYSQYDAPTHHMTAPWDLVYWMQDVRVVATWDPVTSLLPLPLPEEAALNAAEVSITLGHCEKDNVWERFSEDQGPVAASPRVEGTAGGDNFARNLEVEGKRIEKTGSWDFNAYYSDSGTHQGGLFATVDVGFVFIPATNTQSGGL